jgi:hypothetical protein
VGRSRVREMRDFFGERQQRIALGATHPSPCVLAEEEDDKSKDQAQADRESEWDNRHGAAAERPRI